MRERYTERHREGETEVGKREKEREGEKRDYPLVSPVALTGIREVEREGERGREENMALKIRTLYQIVISF